MALQDLLDLSQARKKIGISEERVDAVLPIIRKYISFWREYPDLFVDFMVRGNQEENLEDSTFHFYFYQRVFLRSVMRHQYVYAVFPRAFSKSFLTVLALMVRCILYPRSKLFVTSGGKEQAASILSSKVQEICTLIPAFKREIDWRRGKTIEGKDRVKYIFKNESELDNIAAKESSRGLRRHGGSIEECVGVDGDILQNVIIPIMAVPRRAMDGSSRPEETLSRSQVYVTTAGWKNTFAYDKLISLLVRMITDPDRCIVLGGTWRTPVAMGLQPKTFIKDQKEEGTFNEAGFDREYESIWSGTVEDAFFRPEIFDRNRRLNQPEYEYSNRSSKNAYYVLAVDVGRRGCDTVICVIKVTPQAHGASLKTLVNIITLADEHFEDQAIKIKQLYYTYKARRIVLDANGIGIGLLDYLIKSQTNPDTGEFYPDFGVMNDEEGFYKKFRTNRTEIDAIYALKANAPINTEAHANLQAQMNANKLWFLIDEQTARNKLMGTKMGQSMKPEQRTEYVKPFQLTSILKEELTNLREETEGVNIRLKQVNRKIKKDKVSALEYGLYYIKQEEASKKRRKNFSAKDFMFLN